MRKSTIAGAILVAAGAVALPLAAWSAADAPAQTETQGQTQNQTPPTGPRHPGGSHPGWEHPGWAHPGWMHHGWAEGGWHGRWMPPMMMRHWAKMRLSPRQRCEERLARRAGFTAYIVARLDLTQAQRPLWDKLRSVLDENQSKQQSVCASLPATAKPASTTMLERLGWQERLLSARLDALKEAKPAFETLYHALTPQQRAIVDHPFRHS